MGNKRNIGIDLLRILLALAVVTIHFNAPATGQVSSNLHWFLTKFLVYGVDSLVLPAVNIYVIVSGYFSFLNRRSYKHVINSLVKLWFCLAFFSVGGAFVISLLFPGSVTTVDFISRFFPLVTGEWWYMSVYFATMLISPFLNKAVETFTKKESYLFLGAMLLVCSVLPFLTKFKEVLGVNLGYSFIWFIVLYYTGAVICKYYSDVKSKKFPWFFGGLALINIIIGYSANAFSFLNGFGCGTYNSILLYAQAIVCFLWFKNLNIENVIFKKIISYLSGLSLAVYIFHCQEDIGKTIWRELAPSQYADTFYIIPVYFATVLMIFVLSILIEQLRRKLVSIGRIEAKLTERVVNILYFLWKGLYKCFTEKEN